MTVRTARLAHGLSGAANTPQTIYTCPAGKTAIVKDIRLAGFGGANVQTRVSAVSGSQTNVFFAAVSGAGIPASLVCYVVLEPGDTLVLEANVANGISWWVSGSELEGVAP